MPRGNVSIIRQGQGGWTKPKPVETFYRKCPFCLTKTEHGLYHSHMNGHPSSYQQCHKCGRKHTSRKLNSKPDKRATNIKTRNEQVWGWLRNNLTGIMEYNPVPKFMLYKGTIGNPRRHKGKSFSIVDLHPEFIKYLQTPEAIKYAHDMFSILWEQDKALYAYIYLRAAGYSYAEIDKSGLVPARLCKRKNGKLIQTDSTVIWNQRALNFILEVLPDELTKYWGDIESKRRAIDRNSRVACPKCDGQDNQCNLCNNAKRKWDGTIPKWLAISYHKRIEAGGTWD